MKLASFDQDKKPLLLDGPMGTELARLGVPTPLPGWSAEALISSPEQVTQVHSCYASAGAQVLTTNTFRTQAKVYPNWRELAQHACQLAREASLNQNSRRVPGDNQHKVNTPRQGAWVAGSLAPLRDCYRPDLSPALEDPTGTRAAHLQLAETLAPLCDVLLVETFPAAEEALLALDACLSTGRETWLALTPGPKGDLMTPQALANAGREAAQRGASAVLINCCAAELTLDFVCALSEALSPLPVAFGAYANAGNRGDGIGWMDQTESLEAAQRYAELAQQWRAEGATLLGGCCGTGPAHVRALAELFGSP